MFCVFSWRQHEATMPGHAQAFASLVQGKPRLVEQILMIRKKNVKGAFISPKLRASAGSWRSLVPWFFATCPAHLGQRQVLLNMMLGAAQHLVSMYQCLSRAHYSPSQMATRCKKFLLLYSEWERHILDFRNLAREVCDFGLVNPSLTWVYHDEDFGGLASKHRGGTQSAMAISKLV